MLFTSSQRVTIVTAQSNSDVFAISWTLHFYVLALSTLHCISQFASISKLDPLLLVSWSLIRSSVTFPHKNTERENYRQLSRDITRDKNEAQGWSLRWWLRHKYNWLWRSILSIFLTFFFFQRLVSVVQGLNSAILGIIHCRFDE